MFFNGRIAEAGIWDVVLTTGEIAQLAAGCSPLLIRPSALVSYVPISGAADPELDWMGGGGFTLSGTAAKAAGPPRIIMPEHRSWIFPAGGGTTITGTLAATEGPDVFAGEGTVTGNVTGTLDATEGPDVFAGEGTVTGNVTGTLDATEAPDEFAGTGVVNTTVTGTMAASEGPDVFAGSGEVSGAGVEDLGDTGRKRKRRKPVIEVSSEWEPVPKREEPRVVLPEEPTDTPEPSVPLPDWFPRPQQVILRPGFAPVDEETRMAVQHYIRLRQDDEMILQMLGLQ